MKYKSRTGAIIRIPKGLDEALIAEIKRDADAGYVNRAINKAKRAKNKLGQTVTKDGTIKGTKADNYLQDQETKDIDTNFNLATPGEQVDQWGNKQTVTKGEDGRVAVNQEAGGAASAFRDAAMGAINNFNGGVSRQKAEEAAYGTLTRYMDRDMDRDLEAKKQELANRGIPYNPASEFDPNAKDLWGKTMGAVRENYRAQKDNAAYNSILAGNTAFGTDSTALNAFINSAVNASGAYSGNFNPYQATQTDRSGISQDVMNLTAQQFMQKYGIDKNAAIEREKIQASKEIASKQSAGGGGGGFGIV